MNTILFSAVFVWCTMQFIEGKLPERQILANVSYGSDCQQTMDIYLPAGRDPTVSKVIIFIHGGAWSDGTKEDLSKFLPLFNTIFPRHATVSMNYRLASINSPGLPKQLEDIDLAIQYIINQQAEYKVRPIFGLIGISAGGHLAMLYGYSIDKSRSINVICSIVGPADLTKPEFTGRQESLEALKVLVGNNTYKDNPKVFENASPVTFINRQSPKTISFFGGKDVLVPSNQGQFLENKLDEAGIFNKVYYYPEEGHVPKKLATIVHLGLKIKSFFQNYL